MERRPLLGRSESELNYSTMNREARIRQNAGFICYIGLFFLVPSVAVLAFNTKSFIVYGAFGMSMGIMLLIIGLTYKICMLKFNCLRTERISETVQRTTTNNAENFYDYVDVENNQPNENRTDVMPPSYQEALEIPKSEQSRTKIMETPPPTYTSLSFKVP